MGNALTSFVTTGKGDFKGFVSSVLTDLARMEVAAAESKILSALIPMIAGAFGYDTTGGAGTSTYNSMGGVSHVNFGGGRASGGPVSAGSMYEVAEGGKPELLQSGGKTFLMMGNQSGDVAPISRGSTGSSSSGGNTININTSVTVDSSGSAKSQTSSDSSDAMAKALAGQMEAKAKEVVMRATQPGGILWKQRVGA
jgi:lambda family phage tail tape measure protein